MTVIELMHELELLNARITVLDADLNIRAPKGALTWQLKFELKQHKHTIIKAFLSLDTWRERLRQASSIDEIYEIMEWFRRQGWTDEQRAEISHFYIKKIDQLRKEKHHGEN